MPKKLTFGIAIRLLFVSAFTVGPALAAEPDPDEGPGDAVPSPPALSAYEAQQSWFSRDKAYHFSVSAIGAATIYTLGREMGLGRRPAAVAAVLVMGTAGLLREVLDTEDPENLLTRQRFSRRDMVWNGIGIVVGIAVPDRLLRRRWKKDG